MSFSVHDTNMQGLSVDLNCDMGEGIGNDALIMPWVSSANIACGYHAGDQNTMLATVELAIRHKVSVGAHISLYDRENFGRTVMRMLEGDVYELVIQQLILLNEIASFAGTKMVHVKPHGALYNMSAKDPLLAKVIAQAVRDFDDMLLLYGLSGSPSVHEAEKMGLKTVSEVFADRTYQDDGSLTPRSNPRALIDSKEEALKQVLQMVQTQSVAALSGKLIPIIAGSVCLHSDGRDAPGFAKMIHERMKQEGIAIKSPAHD